MHPTDEIYTPPFDPVKFDYQHLMIVLDALANTNAIVIFAH